MIEEKRSTVTAFKGRVVGSLPDTWIAPGAKVTNGKRNGTGYLRIISPDSADRLFSFRWDGHDAHIERESIEEAREKGLLDELVTKVSDPFEPHSVVAMFGRSHTVIRMDDLPEPAG